MAFKRKIDNGGEFTDFTDLSAIRTFRRVKTIFSKVS